MQEDNNFDILEERTQELIENGDKPEEFFKDYLISIKETLNTMDKLKGFKEEDKFEFLKEIDSKFNIFKLLTINFLEKNNEIDNLSFNLYEVIQLHFDECKKFCELKGWKL